MQYASYLGVANVLSLTHTTNEKKLNLITKYE